MSGTASGGPVLQLRYITYTFVRAIVAYVEYTAVIKAGDNDPSPEETQRMVMAQSLFARMGLTPTPNITWTEDIRDAFDYLVEKLQKYRSDWLAAKQAAETRGSGLNRGPRYALQQADAQMPKDGQAIRDNLNAMDSRPALDMLRGAFAVGGERLTFAAPVPAIICHPPTTEMEKWASLSEAALAIEAEIKADAAEAALARGAKESVYGRVEMQPVFDMDLEEYEQSLQEMLDAKTPTDLKKSVYVYVPPQAANSEGIYGRFVAAEIDRVAADQSGARDYERPSVPFDR